MADEIVFGPAMQALTEKRRKFLLAMLSDPFGTHRQWALDAGYSDVKEGAKVRAHEVLQDPKIQAAALELSRAAMGTMGPILAAAGLLKLAANPEHPQYVKALELLANRVGLQEKQEIQITRRDLTGDALMERVRLLAEKHGIDATRLLGDVSREMKTIEHKADENGS